MLMGKGFDQPRNSVKQIVDYLKQNPNQTETEIQENVFDYFRNETIESNKKYAEILRRALYSGKIKRVRMKIHGIDKRMVFRYYINYI
jgi:hypothetical protein